MEVERLTAVLEASGLGSFTANMAAADKATANVRSNLVGMKVASEGSTVATRNLGAASLTASQHHAKNAKELNEVEKSARGGIASFTGLGRAMFFASNAFLGGALIGGVLKSIVDKTRTTEDAMGQLRIAVKNTGNSWDVMGGQIDSMLKKQGDASLFMKSDLATSMTRFVLSTGSVTKATTELGIATNLARLRHEDLATATQQVMMAGLGHATVLRGLGVAIPKVTTNVDELKAAILAAKNAHEAYAPAAVAAAMATAKQKDMALTGAEALQILADKTKGANAAFDASSAGALARFHHSLDDLEIAMGAVLVPQITKVVNALSGWMDKMDKSGQLTKDLKSDISILKGAFSALHDIIKTVDDVTGGFKQTLELLLALKVVSVLSGWATSLTTLAGSETAGTGAAGAAGAVGKLRSGLVGLTQLAAKVIVISVALDIIGSAHTTKTGLHRYSGSAGWGNLAHDISSGISGMLQPGFSGGGGAGAVGAVPGQLGGFLAGASGGALSSAQIGKMAGAAGLDPKAVLSVSKMEGLGGGIGDGGHAFGPFQLNNAGGVITGMFPGWTNQQIQAWAWSKQGVQFALSKMAGVAGGMKGSTAINAIVRGFERPKNPNAEIAGALAADGFPMPAGGIDLTGATGITKLLGGLHSTAKGKKPPLVPDAVTALLNLAKGDASQAQALGNTGGIAKQLLEGELQNLTMAYSELHAKAETVKGHAHQQIENAMQSIQDKLPKLLKEISDAIVIVGDALLPQKLRAKLTKATAQFTADSDYATVLIGQTADNYRSVVKKDMLSQAAVLQAEQASLKTKLANASGKQKTAIQAELTKVQASLSTVQQSILSNLDANVQSLQSKVSTLFGNVTQQFDAALGKLFFQNGMKTVLEQQLADMQAQDQLNSLTDSIQQAKDQLALDQTGALAGVQFNAATGLTTNLYSASASKQLAADQKAIDAAQRQLDEYNLGIKAAAERTQLDQEYTVQLDTLNKKLATLGEAFQNGTGSMDALKSLADQYGIVISTKNIPDFQGLSDKSKDLKQAFSDLVTYIGTITGVTPKIPAGGAGGGGGTAPANSPGGVLQDLHQQAVNGLLNSADYAYMISGHKLNIPGMASGGIVRAKPGGTIVRLAEAGRDEEVGPVGGRSSGGDLHIHFDGPVYGADADELARALTPKIQAELLRSQRRNAGTTGIR